LTSASRRYGLMLATAATLVVMGLSGCTAGAQEGVLRLGYFPNLTHAQPLYGVSSGLYQERLGATQLQTQTYNAGPSAFQALLAGDVDVIYVGPSPTISALERQGTGVVVIVAGAASGGASFVTRSGIDDPEDLHGHKFATPGQGNTQDVAFKHFLLDHQLKRSDQGGDVEVLNADNAQILALFQKGDIAGAWVPEPWATRLVLEGGGHVMVDESSLWPDGDFVTTHMVTTRAFLRSHGEDVRNLLAAHAQATADLQEPGADVLSGINDGLQEVTGKRIPEETLTAAMEHIEFTDDPLMESFRTEYSMAHDLGFAGPVPDVSAAYDLSYLPTTG
jgi:NitT/TauT family transport system substrate-binding protein